MGMAQVAIAVRLSKLNLHMVQSFTAQNPERDWYQVLDENGNEVFAGTLQDVSDTYPHDC
jgi:hypothetical protein